MFDGFEQFGSFWRTIWSSWAVRIPASCNCSKGFPRLRLMLACVADKQNAIMRPSRSRTSFICWVLSDSTHQSRKGGDLPGRHGWSGPARGSHRQIGLQGVGGDAAATRSSERRVRRAKPHGVAVVLGSFADGCESGGLANSRQAL